MASIKIKFRASQKENREGTLYYQIIHNRTARQISTRCKLYSAEWDGIASQIVIPASADESRRLYLTALQDMIREGSARLKGVAARLARTGKNYTADKVLRLYSIPSDDGCFLSFGRDLVSQLKEVGRIRTAETYTTTLNSFMRFRGNRCDIPLDEVDATLMMEYEAYLKENGVCPNSSSYYMRNLRAIYNRAVDKELTMQRNPFKHVYTGIDKTVKRAVPVKVIRQIRDLNLESNPSMELARDLFMFSFYTRGMSFVDIAYLKKKDLKNGILSYRRQKTNQQLFIKWEQPMQDIVNKYNTTESPYLLPIIKDAEKDVRRQYKNAEHLTNNKLKKIGELLGLTIPLTTYVARHGWASIAKSKHIPISTISEAMGHDSEGTTRIYLASLDTSAVDKANGIILRSI